MALPKFDPNRVPDREFKAKPGEEQCDFCTSREPVYGYPCRGHTTGVVPVGLDGGFGTTTVQSPDDWAACQHCHDLIERGDRDALAKHSADTMPGALPAAIKQMAVRQAHDNFWAAREGAPYVIGSEDDPDVTRRSAPDDPDGKAAEQGQRPHFDNEGNEIQ